MTFSLCKIVDKLVKYLVFSSDEVHLGVLRMLIDKSYKVTFSAQSVDLKGTHHV